MPTSIQSGTQTASVSTEHTLGSSVTDAGTYVLSVNTTNMANGDALELRIKTKTLAGDTEALYVLASYVNAQSEPIKMSIPVPSLHSLTCTLKQTAGTGRAFPWNLIAL